jgi:hypothetical protein
VSERQTTDAEYFYNITLLWLKNGGPEQGHRPNPWFAQLIRHSEGKAKALKRLWSGPSSQGDVLRRFHEIPALFWGISLGNIGKIIAMPRQQVGASTMMTLHAFLNIDASDPKSDQAGV